jgi:hypothetical protein
MVVPWSHVAIQSWNYKVGINMDKAGKCQLQHWLKAVIRIRIQSGQQIRIQIEIRIRTQESKYDQQK